MVKEDAPNSGKKAALLKVALFIKNKCIQLYFNRKGYVEPSITKLAVEVPSG